VLLAPTSRVTSDVFIDAWFTERLKAWYNPVGYFHLVPCLSPQLAGKWPCTLTFSSKPSQSTFQSPCICYFARSYFGNLALATIVWYMTVFSYASRMSSFPLLSCSSAENTLKLLCFLFVLFETRFERTLDCWSADTAATGSRPEGRGLGSKRPDRRPREEHQRHSTMACRGKSRFENLLPLLPLVQSKT
jgi:hypothetical protein